MAIIQISKIQQRSGNLVDLPQLDEAQFGFATDEKRLFIGKTSPNENIEVLTSYSNISFSQLEGSSGGNLNISGPTNGQTLTYVSSTNTWENWSGNASQLGNSKLQLGDVANISMKGGATGYILETDGTGNLAWTSKGTLRTNILGLSNATPIVMTVNANANAPYVNKLAITISGANAANANTIVNGQTFYLKVANDFPTSGNVELYVTANLDIANAAVGTNLGIYTANSGIATALLTGSGVSNAGGSTGTIQFNNSGVIDGSANFTLTGGNIVTLTGNFIANNVNGGNLVTANYFTGTLTTAAQPNITSVGTLNGLVVAGNITPNANITYNLGNNTHRFNDIYLANSTIYIGNQTISGNTTSVTVSGILVANLQGNLSGSASTANTVIDNSQPNITSTGTLTSLSVSGNANIGNLGTTQLLASANITAPTLISNVATGTSPLTISSTTLVSNLNADLLDGFNSDIAGNANTVVVRDVFGGIAGNNISGNSILIAPGQVDPSNVTAFAAGQVYDATSGFNGPGIVIGASVGQHGAIVYASNTMYFGTETGSDNTMGIRAQLDSNSAFTVNTVIATSLSTGNSSTTGNITGNWTLTSGSRFQATYADLAEYYTADQNYEPGTVLEFGGEEEVTIASDGSNRVAGVVSTNPAYAMNSNCQGEYPIALALQGRVPVKVRGNIRKGDMMISAGNGYARPSSSPIIGSVIGKALQNFDDIEGVIEIAIGRL